MEMELICIVCPVGCQLRLSQDEKGHIQSIEGNRCQRGQVYARQESQSPMRMLTSTVRIEKALYPRLPVITSAAIPKKMLGQVMEAINQVRLVAPIRLRQVVIKNVCGLPVDILASRSMKEV